MTMQAIRERHQELEHIEKQFLEVGQLFEDLSAIVEQHEAPITSIEHESEQAHNDVMGAIQEVEPAIISARARNRNKRWCFVILGFIILAIVVAAVVLALERKGTTRA
jgi:syntaxin 1B/2/3